MGNISLCDYFSSSDLDSWTIVSIKAFDKPAAELNFVDVRHAYCLVELHNPKKLRKGCFQSFADCWLGCCLSRCLGGCVRCLTCTCCCGSCCKETTPLEQALYSENILVVIELTGSATKGAFLRQTFYQYDDEVSKENRTTRLWRQSQVMDVVRCLPKDELILARSYTGPLKYGDLRKALVRQFQNTKYSIRDNNCFHFVSCVFRQLAQPTDIIERRQKIIEENVRKHDVLVPTMERMMT